MLFKKKIKNEEFFPKKEIKLEKNYALAIGLALLSYMLPIFLVVVAAFALLIYIFVR